MARYETTGNGGIEKLESDSLRDIQAKLLLTARAHIARMYGSFLVLDNKTGKMREIRVSVKLTKPY